MKKVSSLQAYGSRGSIKMEIYMDIGREFTDSDNAIISNATYDLQEKILNELYRTNPVHIEAGRKEKEELISLFNEPIFVQETHNEYNGDFHRPWLMVTTSIGHFKIGWRKSVINIDWERTIVKAKARDLFPDEDVTKEDTYIHAWGYEKAKEYIQRIIRSIN